MPWGHCPRSFSPLEYLSPTPCLANSSASGNAEFEHQFLSEVLPGPLRRCCTRREVRPSWFWIHFCPQLAGCPQPSSPAFLSHVLASSPCKIRILIAPASGLCREWAELTGEALAQSKGSICFGCCYWIPSYRIVKLYRQKGLQNSSSQPSMYSGSPGDAVKTQALMQQFWGGAWDSCAFLTGTADAAGPRTALWRAWLYMTLSSCLL